jgi:hypothetical protein
MIERSICLLKRLKSPLLKASARSEAAFARPSAPTIVAELSMSRTKAVESVELHMAIEFMLFKCLTQPPASFKNTDNTL